tara:strand:+ start:987 stop:1235 length:249 start_codon:yes stop_codon:yes gene_type:complete
MNHMEIKLTGTELDGVRMYDSNYDNSLEVFTYEIGKYFDYMDDWYLISDTLHIYYTGKSVNQAAVMSRIKTLVSWINVEETA